MRGDVVALDGEVSNSTHSEDFRAAHEDRYFEMFIAEQQLVAAAYPNLNVKVVGTHSGISIGEDGPSQMALEDIASIRAIHGSTVLHPSDANQAAKLVAAMADQPGISFMRTLRGKTPVRTAPDEDVTIGGSRVVTDGDDVAIVACGITVEEAVKAAEALEGDGISARVLDCYSVKPIDAEALQAAARECGGIVTVEDHAPEGGLGDAVLDVLADAEDRPPVVKLAVREIPGSGTPDELIHGAGIDAEAIAGAARRLAKAGASA
jgi:transketolase